MSTTTEPKTAQRKTTKRKPTSRKTKSNKAKEQIMTFTVPAIQGIECDRIFYVGMVPYRLLEKMITFTDPDLPLVFRQQRIINPAKVNKLVRYLGQEFWSMGAVIASVEPPDKEEEGFRLEPMAPDCDLGTLHIPINSKILMADGQHRVQSIIKQYKQDPEFGDNTLPIIFHRFVYLKREQQRFTDHNCNLTKPNASISQFFDQRDEANVIAKILWGRVKIFSDFTELEATSLRARTNKVFTFNAITASVRQMLKVVPGNETQKINVIQSYYQALSVVMLEWLTLVGKACTPQEARKDTLAFHAISVEALGIVGAVLYQQLAPTPDQWEDVLNNAKIPNVNWQTTNPQFDDLIRFDGQILKNAKTTKALANYILKESEFYV